jgi:hypothetical protein
MTKIDIESVQNYPLVKTNNALSGRKSIVRLGRESLYPRITHRWSSTSIAPAIRSMPVGLQRIRELQRACGPSDEPRGRMLLKSSLSPFLQPRKLSFIQPVPFSGVKTALCRARLPHRNTYRNKIVFRVFDVPATIANHHESFFVNSVWYVDGLHELQRQTSVQ